MDKIINIIILDDDLYYRMALERQLQNTIQTIPLNELYTFQFFLYENPIIFLEECKNRKFGNARNFAIIDFYLGKKIQGDYIIKHLNSDIKNFKVILISQSPDAALQIEQQNLNHIDFIEKTNYCLTMCSLLFENFVEGK